MMRAEPALDQTAGQYEGFGPSIVTSSILPGTPLDQFVEVCQLVLVPPCHVVSARAGPEANASTQTRP